jgi:excisionase family DNA binding protein
VRIPTAAADALDREAFERRVHKQDVVAELVDRHLGGPGRVTVELPAEGLTVGRHEFRPVTPPEVLTVADAAELLRVEPDAVRALAESGELPGRRVGEDWRFARAALLRWLGGGG